MHWGKELRQATAKEIVEAIRSRGETLRQNPQCVPLDVSLLEKRQVLLDLPPHTFKLIQGKMVFPYEILVGSGRQFTMLTCLTAPGKSH